MKLRKQVGLGICSLLFMISFSVNAAYVPSGIYVNAGAGIGYLSVDETKVDKENIEKTGSNIEDYSIQSQNEPAKGEDKITSNYKIAAGYANAVKSFRFELAYLKNSSVEYELDTLFDTGANPQINDFKNKINSSAVMINGYLDMLNKYSRMMPYMTVGIGYASNKVEWLGTSTFVYSYVDAPEIMFTISNPVSSSKKTSSLAWQAGIGARIKVTNNLFADLSIQHLSLGKAGLDSIVTQGELSGSDEVQINQKLNDVKISTNQVMFSLTLFFGDQSEPAPSLILDI